MTTRRRVATVAVALVAGLMLGSLLASPDGARADGPSAQAISYAGSGSGFADAFVLAIEVPGEAFLSDFFIEFVSTRPPGDYDGFPVPVHIGHFHYFAAPDGFAQFTHGFSHFGEGASRHVEAAPFGTVEDFRSVTDPRNITGGTVEQDAGDFFMRPGTHRWIIVTQPPGLLEVSYSFNVSRSANVSHGFDTGGFLLDHREFDATAQAWQNGLAMVGLDWEHEAASEGTLVAWFDVDLQGLAAGSFGAQTPTGNDRRTFVRAAGQEQGFGAAPEFLFGPPGEYRFFVDAAAQAAGRNVVTLMAADVDLSVA